MPKATKLVLHSAQDVFETMRSIYASAPRWFAGHPAVVTRRLVRLVLARYDVDVEIGDELTPARRLLIAELMLEYARSRRGGWPPGAGPCRM